MKKAFYKRADRIDGAWLVYYEQDRLLKDIRVFSCPFEAKKSADRWELDLEQCPTSPPRYMTMILVCAMIFMTGVVLYEFGF